MMCLHMLNDNSHLKAHLKKGIYKICDMDKDSHYVLLCNSFDSKYHMYYLNPLVVRVPKRNRHSLCVTGKFLHENASYGTQIVSKG